MKKIMLLLAVLVVASTVVFAGGRTETQTQTGTTVVRWSFWGGESRIRAYQLGNDVFFEDTGIVIAGEPAPGATEHFTKFQTQFLGGNAADVIGLGGWFNSVPGLDDNDPSPYFLPLDQFVRSGILDISTVDPSAIATGTRNGVLYALPNGTNMPALVYNRSLLERVGAPLPRVSMTWAEFEAWLTQVKARLPANVYPMYDASIVDSSTFFGYWAGDNGTPQYVGKVNGVHTTRLTAADAQKYFEMWARWRAAGLIPPASVSADFAETNEASSSLVAGRTAVCFIWTNQLLAYQGATRDTLDLIEMPNAAVSNGLWGQASQMLAINRNSKNPQAAARFINFRINDPRSWAFTKNDPGNPITPATRAAIPADDPIVARITAYMSVAGAHTSTPNPNVPSDTEWNNNLRLISQNVAFGRRTPAQAGQDVMDLLNRLFRENP